MQTNAHEGAPDNNQAADPLREGAGRPEGDSAGDVAAAAECVLATASPSKAYTPLDGDETDPRREPDRQADHEANRGASALDHDRRYAMVDTDRVTGTVKEFAGAAQRSTGDAAGSPGNSSVEGRFREAEGKVEQLYGQAKDALRQGVDRLGDVARDAYVDPASYVRHGGNAARRQVEGNPLVAVLIAGAVGYLLSYLVHGKH